MNIIIETWKDIPDFVGLYKISNFGRVKAIEKIVKCVNSNKIRKYYERFLKIRLTQTGYLSCVLCKNNIHKHFFIHRLMAFTWLTETINTNDCVVHHINNNKLDNSIENLKWVSKKENSSCAALDGKYNRVSNRDKKVRKKYTKINIPEYYYSQGILDNEIWKDIIGYENYYQISNFGRVKGLTREVTQVDRNGNFFSRIIKEKIICPHFSKNAYLSVHLHNTTIKAHSIHRLVAKNFITNIYNYEQVHHRDNNPMNNNVSNLEWVTPMQNNIYARESGNIDLRGEKGYFSKLNTNQVLEIRNSNQSNTFLSKQFNVSRKSISNIKNRKTWKHI